MVQFRAVAVLDHGLARQDRRPKGLLPHRAAQHGLRHPLLLGCADDDARHCDDRRGALPQGLHSRPRTRCRQAEDVQDQGQRDRPDRDDRALRHGRRSIRAGGFGRTGLGRGAQGRAHRRLPHVCEQDLERAALRRHEPGEGRRRRVDARKPGRVPPAARRADRRGVSRRPLDLLETAYRGGPSQRTDRQLPLPRSREHSVPLFLARVLRLVHRAQEALLRGRERLDERLEEHARRHRAIPAAAAPDHAVHHRRPVAAADGQHGRTIQVHRPHGLSAIG